MSTQKITLQANKLWQILSAPSTTETYGQALSLTGTIIRETALLLWLAICFVLVIFDWGGAFAVSTGRKFRAWFDGLQEAKTEEWATTTWENLVATGKNSVASTIALARQQLGLPEKPADPEPAPAPTKPAPAPSPTLTPASSKPAAPPTPVADPTDLPPAETSDVE